MSEEEGRDSVTRIPGGQGEEGVTSWGSTWERLNEEVHQVTDDGNRLGLVALNRQNETKGSWTTIYS